MFNKTLLGVGAAALILGTAAAAWAATSVNVNIKETINGKTTVTKFVSGTPKPSTSPIPKFNAACMQAALEKRDNAIIASLDSFHTLGTNALKNRLAALKAAWALTERKPRRDAINKAWKDFRLSSRDARAQVRIGKREAWKKFRADQKACGSGAFVEDGTNEAVDINL